MGVALPGESREYRAARDRLLEREIELRRAMEAVAALRRELPPGGPVETDYVCRRGRGWGAGRRTAVELFEPGKDPPIYSFCSRATGDQTPGPPDGRAAPPRARRVRHCWTEPPASIDVVAKAPLRGSRREGACALSSGNTYNAEPGQDTCPSDSELLRGSTRGRATSARAVQLS